MTDETLTKTVPEAAAAALLAFAELCRVLSVAFQEDYEEEKRERAQKKKEVPQAVERVRRAGSPAELAARRDLLQLLAAHGHIPVQSDLAVRWGVSAATISRWVRLWETEGIITIRREQAANGPVRNAILGTSPEVKGAVQ